MGQGKRSKGSSETHTHTHTHLQDTAGSLILSLSFSCLAACCEHVCKLLKTAFRSVSAGHLVCT